MKAIYECRLCGERYTEFHTERKSAFIITSVIAESNYYPTEGQAKIRLSSVHKCRDGSIGFSDFQGFKKEEKET